MDAAAFADQVQAALWKLYWDPERGTMHQWDDSSSVNRPDENYYYWWQAHAVDVCIDGLIRTGNSAYAEYIEQLFHGIRQSNGGTFRHYYYDDMEWMALAWLRVYDVTGDRKYREAVADLWEDIRGGWNEQMGGGIAWRKSQLDYKNTPANAPAAILGARLYQRFGDGQIDKDWQFTYCQGVFIGAGLELYACTGEAVYQADARRTTDAVFIRLCGTVTGTLPDEGIDDTGLFKGILIRYLLQTAKTYPDFDLPARLIINNAYMLMKHGLDNNGRVGTDWRKVPLEGPIQLSVMLSGVMLLEAYAELQCKGDK
jgi:predicted alpha-1,6-mannanase (GH76 family)